MPDLFCHSPKWPKAAFWPHWLSRNQLGKGDHCIDSSGAGQWLRSRFVCHRSHLDISFLLLSG